LTKLSPLMPRIETQLCMCICVLLFFFNFAILEYGIDFTWNCVILPAVCWTYCLCCASSKQTFQIYANKFCVTCARQAWSPLMTGVAVGAVKVRSCQQPLHVSWSCVALFQLFLCSFIHATVYAITCSTKLSPMPRIDTQLYVCMFDYLKQVDV